MDPGSVAAAQKRCSAFPDAVAVAAIGMLALLLAGLEFAAASAASGVSAARAPSAKIVFVDVGEGDAVVMRVGRTVVVSDSGGARLANVTSALRAVGAKVIDVVIATHPHDDHDANFVRLFAEWKVKRVVMSRSDWWTRTATNRAVRAAIEAEGLSPTYAHAADTFGWGGARWTILNPPKGRYTGATFEQTEDASIAYLLEIGRVEMLFTGDVLSNVATAISTRLAALGRNSVSIFLVTHHGSRHSFSPQLLALAKPRWAVLSSGPNNHGLPSVDVVSRLRQSKGTSIWCTDANGSITATISAAGAVRWTAAGARATPWWPASAASAHGRCGARK